jgi:hypothetical protein
LKKLLWVISDVFRYPSHQKEIPRRQKPFKFVFEIEYIESFMLQMHLRAQREKTRKMMAEITGDPKSRRDIERCQIKQSRCDYTCRAVNGRLQKDEVLV